MLSLSINKKTLRWSVATLLGVGLVVAIASFVSDAQRQGECRGNLIGFGIALTGYLSSHGSFPSGTVPNASQPPEKRLSWIVVLYSESWFGANVVLLVDQSQPWDAAGNLNPKVKVGREGEGQTTVVSNENSLCICPSERKHSDSRRPNLTNYIGISGLGTDAPTLPLEHPRAGIFGYERRTSLPGHQGRPLGDRGSRGDERSERPLDGWRTRDDSRSRFLSTTLPGQGSPVRRSPPGRDNDLVR